MPWKQETQVCSKPTKDVYDNRNISQ